MPAALWFLLLCDRMVVERVPPFSVSCAFAVGLPTVPIGAAPPAPPGAAFGPGGTQSDGLFWARAMPPERASTPAAIVEIFFSMSFLQSGQGAKRTPRRRVRCAGEEVTHDRFQAPPQNTASCLPKGSIPMD